MTELVLAINRDQLNKQSVGIHGLYPIDYHQIEGSDYALLPRAYADNKSVPAIAVGAQFPQILGYFQIVDTEGRILAYQRKGKEKGLFGKWSIGVGGHVSQEDLCEHYSEELDNYPSIQELIWRGAERELLEELNLELCDLEQFAGGQEDFGEQVEHVLCSMIDPTSSVHIGIPMEIQLDSWSMESLKLDPSEFCNFKWMTKEELKASDMEFETWSKILVETM